MKRNSTLTNTSLTVTRIIRSKRERVFDAWTKPDLILKWWGPGTTICPEASVDLRVGGAIRIANKIDDGRIVWISGEFEYVEPPSRLIYSWIMGTEMEDPSRVTVDFNNHPDGTELVLTHERIASENVRKSHLQGWNGCLDGLQDFLAGETSSAA
jgi:uncharacterized protein YndB with AHSA1/START domain